MAIKEFFIKLFKGLGGFFSSSITRFFTWDLLFGLKLSVAQKILRVFGLTNFILTIVFAVKIGIDLGTGVPDTFLQILIELIKTIVGTDQYVYELSTNLSRMANPAFLDHLKIFFLVINKSFYFVWWHKLFSYLIQNQHWVFPINVLIAPFVPAEERKNIDGSTVKSKIGWWAFKMLYAFIIISNIIFMVFVSKSIVFDLQPLDGDIKKLPQNIFRVADTLAKNWYHFIWGFKGIMHYAVYNLADFISIITGTQIDFGFNYNVTTPLQNTTNST